MAVCVSLARQRTEASRLILVQGIYIYIHFRITLLLEYQNQNRTLPAVPFAADPALVL